MLKTTTLPLISGLLLAHAAIAADFSLTSTSDFLIKHNTEKDSSSYMQKTQAFNGNGCDGDNISPLLQWHNAPANTKSFALTLFDPDAPTMGRGWSHWIIFNIPKNTHELKAGAGSHDSKELPKGAIQSINDFGQYGYDGPCPPKGDSPHHYHFTIYALDVAKLPLKKNTPAAQVAFYIHSHTLAKATLTGLYGRDSK